MARGLCSKSARRSARAERDLLASELVHDLRTFLTVVYCTGQMIQEESRCPVALYYAQHILKSCESFDRLLKDLLSLSQAKLRTLPMLVQPVSIVEELTNITQAYKLHAKRKGLALTVRFEGPIPRTVRTDGLRLHQIVSNIVGNAVKFTAAGKVEIACRYAEEILHLTVTDTGIGIANAEQKDIFDTHRRRGKAKRFADSHGLGLAIARRLARRMGGDVRLLRSKLGLGSVFEIKLRMPLEPVPNDREDVIYAGIIECT